MQFNIKKILLVIKKQSDSVSRVTIALILLYKKCKERLIYIVFNKTLPVLSETSGSSFA